MNVNHDLYEPKRSVQVASDFDLSRFAGKEKVEALNAKNAEKS
jgi:hypothetical protein